MAGLHIEEGVPRHLLRRKLGAAVQSIQWSYAIFWSLSSEQQVLEWGDGFYNGDIKTRKTVLPMELSSEHISLQRTHQLRDLYETLSAGENSQQAKRPCAALSPEDLTDTEWFYMVCMSFVFTPGQGLPGRAFAVGHHVWLYDAHYADSKEFTRSLLAKSAGIQTVACFPCVNGVLEFGVNESVAEDPAFVQQMLTFFLEVSRPACTEQSTSSPRRLDDEDEDHTFTKLDSERAVSMLTEKMSSSMQCSQLSDDQKAFPPTSDFCLPQMETKNNVINKSHIIAHEAQSPVHSLNENGLHQHDDSYVFEELTDTCQVQICQNVAEETSGGRHGSLGSSDCSSHSFIDDEKFGGSIHHEKLNQYMQELQECTHRKFDNCHYSKTLSAILCNFLLPKPVNDSNGVFLNPFLSNGCNDSGFSRWRKGVNYHMQLVDTPQKLLKKVLFEVAGMHQKDCNAQGKVGEVDDLSKHNGAGSSHILSEQRGREKMDERFTALRSVVPSISKFWHLDRASLLGDAVEYVKELEKRVEELKACKELVGRKRCPDVTERTFDNCDSNLLCKKPCRDNRNAAPSNGPKNELQWVLCKDGLTDVMVTITDKEVSVEIQCPWRESLLLEIVQAMSDLHLAAESIKSSMVNSILKLSLRAKVKKAMMLATEDVKLALQRIVTKC